MNRDEYYVFQPHYYILKDLSKMIADKNVLCQELKSYMELNKLDANSYINYIREHEKSSIWMPLVYFVSMYDFRVDFFKYLISAGADPRKLTDSDIELNICFICHDRYLQYLSQKAPPKKNVSVQIQSKLVSGTTERLRQLLKLNALTSTQIKEAVREPVLATDIINMFINRIMVVSLNFDERVQLTHQLIEKYLDVFQFMKTYDANLVSIQDLCKKYYLYEFLEMIEGTHSEEEPLYHTHMDATLVASLRPLLNDKRYVKTCEIVRLRQNNMFESKPVKKRNFAT